MGVAKCVLLSTYGSRGDVEPLVGLAVRLRALGADVVQTGAWILPDVHPLPADLEAFLDAGTPPVYVGFGSMPMRTSTDVTQVAIKAIRAQGRRALVSRGWTDLALIDDRDDCFVVGEVNQQAPASNSTGFQDHSVRSSNAVQRILNDVKFTVVEWEFS